MGPTRRDPQIRVSPERFARSGQAASTIACATVARTNEQQKKKTNPAHAAISLIHTFIAASIVGRKRYMFFICSVKNTKRTF